MATDVLNNKRSTALDLAVADCRKAVGIVALISLAINLLMLTQPLYMIQVYDRVLVSGHVETLVLLTLIATAALLLLAALDAVRTAVTTRVGCWLNDRLGPVFLSVGVRSRLQGDTAGAQPMRDLAQIQNFIATQGLTVFFDAPWTPVFIVLVWMLHPALGMLSLASAILLLGLSVLNEVATRRATLVANLSQIAATQQAEATIRNAEVVRAMGMLPALVARWQATNGTAQDALQRSSEHGGIFLAFTKFVRMFVQVAVLGLGAMLVLRGEITAGAMIAASILLGRALAPVELAMSAWRNFTATRIAYARLRARLAANPPETDRIRLPTPTGRLSVDKITYLTGDHRPILRQVSFAVSPGEAVAVVGPSAAGKSTLCRLLVGTSSAKAGEIRLDGSEISHWDADQLGRHIGYLPQDVELFSGTVRENIARMGEVDDAAVIEAARLAHAHEMIQQLPDGYETQIGDQGVRLSGGQRQRIGLARAVYGDPCLIILDEPNANLDQAGEAALAAALDELKARDTALIIVGHRPSTLAQADKILLLKEGRVELFGPRDLVLARLREAATAKAAENGSGGDATAAETIPGQRASIQRGRGREQARREGSKPANVGAKP